MATSPRRRRFSWSIFSIARASIRPTGTAGELVAFAAFDARERLVAAGEYHGIAWARFSEIADGTTIQVITWGDLDGRLLFRAEGASREVLAEAVARVSCRRLDVAAA